MSKNVLPMAVSLVLLFGAVYGVRQGIKSLGLGGNETKILLGSVTVVAVGGVALSAVGR